MDRINLKPLGTITGTMAYSSTAEGGTKFKQLQNFELWTRAGVQTIDYQGADSMRLITAGPGKGLLELSATFPMDFSSTAIEFGGRLPQLTYEPGVLAYPYGVGNPPQAIYGFGRSASLTEDLAGPWRGNDPAGAVDMRFDIDGFFSVVDSKGCLVEGTATPAASGHNLFTVRLVDCADHRLQGFAVVMAIDGDENLFMSAIPAFDIPGGAFAFHGVRCETCTNNLSLVRPDSRAATQ
jgi:hypothetical protein